MTLQPSPPSIRLQLLLVLHLPVEIQGRGSQGGEENNEDRIILVFFVVANNIYLMQQNPKQKNEKAFSIMRASRECQSMPDQKMTHQAPDSRCQGAQAITFSKWTDVRDQNEKLQIFKFWRKQHKKDQKKIFLLSLRRLDTSTIAIL